jgi:hypothetical protein
MAYNKYYNIRLSVVEMLFYIPYIFLWHDYIKKWTMFDQKQNESIMHVKTKRIVYILEMHIKI